MTKVIHSLIHAFNKHLLGTCFLPDYLVCTVGTKIKEVFAIKNL